MFKHYNFRNNISITVFDLSDVDLMSKSINGNLVSDVDIKQVTIEIPRVIFNFSFQRKKTDIRKLRSMLEMDKVTIVNEVNQFNQWMIMEILASSEIFRHYLLPYKVLDPNTFDDKTAGKKSFLLIPQSGSNISKAILVRNKNSRFDVYQNSKIHHVNKNIVQTILNSDISRKTWMLLNVPEIILYDNKPLVQRLYLQRDGYGEWNILSGRFLSQEYDDYRINISNYYGILLTAVKYISNFIPSLGNCFVDLVFDTRGNPYFLHFGGWDQDYFLKNQNSYLNNIFARNLLTYSMYRIEKEKGE